jgi:serine/threonine-protein kinase
MDMTLIAGRYGIRDLLGSGAGGTVLEAMDHRLGRLVALKLIRRPAADDPDAEEALRRARQEAQAAGRLSHPGIVAVHDVGQGPDYAWIVLELVIGETLQAALRRDGPPPLEEAVRIMTELLAALGAAHARGIIHRDVKPANILLAVGPEPGWGQVRLTDFGIARLDEAGLTLHGQMLGTPSAMAPEQVRGEVADERADLWAAGVVLYQLLTGARPFEGAPIAIMQAILNQEPPPPAARAAGVPPAMDAVIARALAKRREDRFPDAAAMAEAIRLAARPDREPAPRRTHSQGFFGLLRRGRP